MRSFRTWRSRVCENIPPTSRVAIRRDIPARRTNRGELANIFLPMLLHAACSFQKLRNVRRWDFRSSRWLSIYTTRHDQRVLCGYYESVHCSIYFWPRGPLPPGFSGKVRVYFTWITVNFLWIPLNRLTLRSNNIRKEIRPCQFLTFVKNVRRIKKHLWFKQSIKEKKKDIYKPEFSRLYVSLFSISENSIIVL